MYKGFTIAVVIPALDEQENIIAVVSGLRALLGNHDQALVDDIVVCDNGSSDATAVLASDAGARVFYQSQRGYGIACMTAIAALKQPDIVVFVDGDNSVDYGQVIDLLAMINTGADLVIGAREKKQMVSGALSLPQRYGNRFAACLIRLLWGQSVTDLGPFRAIRYPQLIQLAMADQQFGWTVEMQVKAIQQGL